MQTLAAVAVFTACFIILFKAVIYVREAFIGNTVEERVGAATMGALALFALWGLWMTMTVTP